MVRKLNIADMSDEVRAFFQNLAREDDVFAVIEDQGKPVVGIVPPRELEDREKQRKLLMDTVREVWSRTQDISSEEIEREVEEAIQEYRRESRS